MDDQPFANIKKKKISSSSIELDNIKIIKPDTISPFQSSITSKINDDLNFLSEEDVISDIISNNKATSEVNDIFDIQSTQPNGSTTLDPSKIIINNEENNYINSGVTVNEENNYINSGLMVNEQQVVVSDISKFMDEIKQYILQNNPKLYILTPCYGGLTHLNYTMCLIKTLDVFKTLNFPVQVEFCQNDSLVTRARNNLIAKAYSDIEATHFMFIDNDISWEPIDILKMILDNKPVIGGVYPLKKYEWSKLIKDPLNPYNSNVLQTILNKKNNSILKNYMNDEDFIQCFLVKYNLNYINNVLKIENNTAKVKHIATGFMMIQRNTISQLFIKYPNTKYKDDVGFLNEEENKNAYMLFDTSIEDEHYLSEDWHFCSICEKCNIDIFINVSVNLTHTGSVDFKGSFLTSIM